MRILFISGKGGVGKSTLAYLFCLSLAKVGKTVAVIDLDPQQSLTHWLRDAEFAHGGPESEIQIVDTPPRLEEARVLRAVTEADRIVIPTMPSPADIAVARVTAEVVNLRKQPSCRAMVLMNRVRKGTVYGRTMLTQTAEGLRLSLPLCRSMISDREVFKHVLVDGLTALDGPARDEILNLALEVQ